MTQESARYGSLRAGCHCEPAEAGKCKLIGRGTSTSAEVVRNGKHRLTSLNIFDLERITAGTEDAFLKYLCHTKDGKSFRNEEYLRIKNGQLDSFECYFGEQSSFPSAASIGQK